MPRLIHAFADTANIPCGCGFRATYDDERLGWHVWHGQDRGEQYRFFPDTYTGLPFAAPWMIWLREVHAYEEQMNATRS